MVRLATPIINGIARLIAPVVRRVRIEGVSMVPTYGPGEYVWVRRMWRPPAIGTVVVARDPEVANREVVKRVAAQRSGYVTLRGDNAEVSRDSRDYGEIAIKDVKWQVIPQRRP
jgi:signal peptidase I